MATFSNATKKSAGTTITDSNLWDGDNLPWADDNLPWQDEATVETGVNSFSNAAKNTTSLSNANKL